MAQPAEFTDFTSHESMVFPAKEGATDPADVRVPAFLPDTATVPADHAHHYDLMHTMDGHVDDRVAELEADGAGRHDNLLLRRQRRHDAVEQAVRRRARQTVSR